MEILKDIKATITFIVLATRYILHIFFGEMYVMAVDFEWNRFKLDYNKTYNDDMDEFSRYKVFRKNMARVEEHNERYKQGLVTWTIGINKFSDLTEEEYQEAVAAEKLKVEGEIQARTKHRMHEFNGNAPASMDWRQFGAVTQVRRQTCDRKCGCCWAMAAVGAIESQYAILYNRRVLLSPQELIDCSTHYKNRGCSGGSAKEAFKYIINNGLGSEFSYPYNAKNGTCYRNKPVAKLIDYVLVPNDEKHLIDAVGTVGPVVVSLNVQFMKGYTSGILKCPKKIPPNNHEVLMVGYGEENGVPYWLLKNSWGEKWGENGYMKIERSDGSTQCGILNPSYPSYPVIE
ncbi:unnamed protein product [Phyllotreta striolata]|uniref:Uncharacterized protein n=1 Tax=Phyllotreta striolata TaxID=444603 RepID=A0A9N9TJW5_PHYSR|nr:unnamed protein product [Phyllotreta striolata]